MLQNAVQSYASVERQTISGRDTEARVLTKGARMLADCQKNWDAPGRKEKLDAALKFNQKIWSIFQVELSNANNPLSQKLKTDLLNLSGFIDKQIFKAIAFPLPENLTMIIKINQNIAAGLRGSTKDTL